MPAPFCSFQFYFSFSKNSNQSISTIVLNLPQKNFMDHNLITTAFGFDGYKITKHYGIVRGIIVRSRSIIGNIGAGFQALVGGNITLYTQLCEKARMNAYEEMIIHADALGANAIIGMRYDANEIAQGITEVLAYGTAVYIEKV